MTIEKMRNLNKAHVNKLQKLNKVTLGFCEQKQNLM
jgi:hypothetical protein